MRPTPVEREQAKVLGTLLLVQVLFGLFPVSGKLAFMHLHPLALAAIRTVGAGLLVWLVVAARGGRIPWRAHWPSLLVFSLLGVIINQGLFVLGLARTTAVHATLLVATIPVWTYAAAVLLGREDLGPRRALGIGLAFTGVAVLVGLGGMEGPEQLLGDVLVVLNAISYALFLVLSKEFTQEHGALPVTGGILVIGALVFVPIGLASGLVGQASVMPASAWAVVAFIVLGPTFLAYVLTATALRKAPASTVAVFIFLQPVIAALTARWILGESLTWRILPAAALVFAGVWLVARRRPHVLRGAVPES